MSADKSSSVDMTSFTSAHSKLSHERRANSEDETSEDDKLLITELLAMSTRKTSSCSVVLSRNSVLKRSSIHCLTLVAGEKSDDTTYQLEQSTTLRFILSPSIDPDTVRLFTNHPLTAHDSSAAHYIATRPFNLYDSVANTAATRELRNLSHSYRELTWTKQRLSNFWSTPVIIELYTDVQLIRAGPFQYYFTTDGSSDRSKANGFGCFIVEPKLTVGRLLQTPIPLNAVVCQTVLSKNLGPLDTWLGRLIVAKMSGYNAIHFTPIQELGLSNSAYALRDFFRLNPVFGCDVTLYDIASLLERFKTEHNMLLFTDLVLNHAATESEWLGEHPQAVYNLANSPHLKPAFLMDRVLVRLSGEVAAGQWADAGVLPRINCDQHLEALRGILEKKVINELKLWEFYQVDVDCMLLEVQELLLPVSHCPTVSNAAALSIELDPQFHRRAATIDVRLAASRLIAVFTEVERSSRLIELRESLEQLNRDAETVVRSHLWAAVNNTVNAVRSRFIDPQGERLQQVSDTVPLVSSYFYVPEWYNGTSTVYDEELSSSDLAVYIWVHNGWVAEYHADPLHNFAERASNVYLRRELNSWTDSVKLRYGSQHADSPQLWDHIAAYVATTVSVFDGVRLDNCHSTPLPVCDYMLSVARSVRPDVFVFAELYAGSQRATRRIANRLGLSAIICSALCVGGPRHLAEEILLSGGRQLGSLLTRPIDTLHTMPLHRVFFDQTHDDPSPHEHRRAIDALPTTSLVSAVVSAIGSNRGYDELVPHRISVIEETRFYRPWQQSATLSGHHVTHSQHESRIIDTSVMSESGDLRTKHHAGMTQSNVCGCDLAETDNNSVSAHDESSVGYTTGMISVKRLLNELHVCLAEDGYNEVGVEVLSDDVIAVMRYSPTTHRSYVTIAHTAFNKQQQQQSDIRPLEIPGVIDSIYLEASVTADSSVGKSWQRNETLITGLSEYVVSCRRDVSVSDSSLVSVRPSDIDSLFTTVTCQQLPPGATVVLQVSLAPTANDAITHLDMLVSEVKDWVWCRTLMARSQDGLETIEQPAVDSVEQMKALYEQQQHDGSELQYFYRLLSILSTMSMHDASCVLYNVESERRSDGQTFNVYYVPGLGELSYCGVAGVASVLAEIRQFGLELVKHPVGLNLCAGDWLLDYTVNRLLLTANTQALGRWLSDIFSHVRCLPRYLVPAYFDATVSAVHELLLLKM